MLGGAVRSLRLFIVIASRTFLANLSNGCSSVRLTTVLSVTPLDESGPNIPSGYPGVPKVREVTDWNCNPPNPAM